LEKPVCSQDSPAEKVDQAYRCSQRIKHHSSNSWTKNVDGSFLPAYVTKYIFVLRITQPEIYLVNSIVVSLAAQTLDGTHY
jgi:hypothetical protein